MFDARPPHHYKVCFATRHQCINRLGAEKEGVGGSVNDGKSGNLNANCRMA
jgi:hypothetical protein